MGANVSERQFRSYWERTSEVGNTNERIRRPRKCDNAKDDVTLSERGNSPAYAQTPDLKAAPALANSWPLWHLVPLD